MSLQGESQANACMNLLLVVPIDSQYVQDLRDRFLHKSQASEYITRYNFLSASIKKTKLQKNKTIFLFFLQYFEQDDPDLYLSKIKYILENDVEEMELYFVEEEYDKDGQLLKVRSYYIFIYVTLFKFIYYRQLN